MAQAISASTHDYRRYKCPVCKGAINRTMIRGAMLVRDFEEHAEHTEEEDSTILAADLGEASLERNLDVPAPSDDPPPEPPSAPLPVVEAPDAVSAGAKTCAYCGGEETTANRLLTPCVCTTPACAQCLHEW